MPAASKGSLLDTRSAGSGAVGYVGALQIYFRHMRRHETTLFKSSRRLMSPSSSLSYPLMFLVLLRVGEARTLGQ